MQNNFDPLIIRGKSLIPVVQGGMGVGVSASKLSSAVARENGVGTIASVDLRHLSKTMPPTSVRRANPVLTRL